MIHKIKLKNFKQHTDLELDFTQGLNVISGNNGAGKSTVLKAVMYALFGATAAGSKQHLSTWGTENKMEVTLHATIAGKSLIILRSFDKSVIYHGETLLASGNSPCTKFVEQELGLDYKTFKHLLYAGQGETQALLKMGASDLQRKIESITKLDGIDKIISFISEDLSVLNGKLSTLPEPADLGKLESDLNELDKSVAWNTNLMKQKEQMSMELRTNLSADQQKLKVMSEAVKQARTSKIAYETLSKSLDKAKAELELHEQAKPVASAKVLKSEILAMEDYIEKNEKRLRESKANTATLVQAREGLDLVGREQREFEQIHAIKFGARLNLYESMKEAYNQMLRVEERLQDLEKVKTECFACNRPFDSAEHLARHKAKLEQAQIEFKEAELNYLELRASLAYFDADTHKAYTGDKLQAKKQVEDNCEKALKNFNAANALTRFTDEEFHILSQDIFEAKKTLTFKKPAYEQAVKWEHQQESLISQMTRMLDELEAVTLVVCDWTEADLTECEEAVKLLQDRLYVSDSHLNELRYTVSGLNSDFKSAQFQLDKAKAEQSKRLQFEKDQADRKDLQKYLRDNRTRMLSETWDVITALTSGYTSEITEGLIHSLTRDESGDFYVQEGEFNIPVTELSGAREGIVGLCLRIALGRAFYGDSSFILLDEVDSAATDYNSAAIAATLSSLDTQVLMVSHRQGVNNSASNVIVLGL